MSTTSNYVKSRSGATHTDPQEIAPTGAIRYGAEPANYGSYHSTVLNYWRQPLAVGYSIR